MNPPIFDVSDFTHEGGKGIIDQKCTENKHIFCQWKHNSGAHKPRAANQDEFNNAMRAFDAKQIGRLVGNASCDDKEDIDNYFF